MQNKSDNLNANDKANSQFLDNSALDESKNIFNHHSPEFIEMQRLRLLDLREALLEAVHGMTQDTIRNTNSGPDASGSGQHQGDAGSEAFDRDFALSMLAKEQNSIYEIDQALRKILANTYGICEISGQKIPQARLEALPFARLTVECQEQWEKEHGRGRFRSSNEIGFGGSSILEEEEVENVVLDTLEDNL